MGLGEIASGVKMPCTRSQTKRPREALLQLVIGYRLGMFSVGGSLRAPMRPHPSPVVTLIMSRNPAYETVAGG